MAFLLTQADQDALDNVDIEIAGDGTKFTTVYLGRQNLMFPPIVTKDSKTAKWLEIDSASYEPFKYYVQSESRKLGLEFQWVTGGYNGGNVNPEKLHDTISGIKSYFYGAYFGGDKKEYPAVKINKLYGLINQEDGDSAAFRMMNVDVKYSKEMTKVDEVWYPLHVKLSMDLESASKLKNQKDQVPFNNFVNLPDKPNYKWF